MSASKADHRGSSPRQFANPVLPAICPHCACDLRLVPRDNGFRCANAACLKPTYSFNEIAAGQTFAAAFRAAHTSQSPAK
jgi:hypothetical protein